MRPIIGFGAAATALLLLTSCAPAASSPGSADLQTSAAPTTTPSPTPTIDPGPVELSKVEAADRFLGVVCQRNSLTIQLNDAFNAQEDDFLNGGSGDVSQVKAIAAESQRVNRLAIEIIDDSYYTWPAEVGEPLKTVRQAYIGLSSYYDGLMNADTFEEAYYLSPPDSAGATAAQEIRYQLGLPADTSSSCAGKETITDTLHTEMTERNAYLATFSASDEAA